MFSCFSKISAFLNQHPALKLFLWWLLWATLTCLYLWWPIQTDFYTDEAYFSEMTLRFLEGQLPNLDFASNYFGLFYAYNALWFKLLGPSYFTLRMGMLFLSSVLFIPAVFFLSCKLLPRRWAILSTLLTLALTISFNYSVSGNWYALYFSLLSILWHLCLLSPTPAELPKKWPALITGVLLGICFLMKHTIALYTISALFLGLISQVVSSPSSSSEPACKQAHWTQQAGYWLSLLGCLLMPVSISVLISQHLDAFRLAFYIAPITLVCATLAYRLSQRRNDLNCWPLFHAIGLWLTGWLIPLVLFCLPYYFRADGLQVLFKAIFIDYPKIYLSKAFLDYAQAIVPSSWSLSLWLFTSGLLMGKSPRWGTLLLSAGLLLVLFNSRVSDWNNQIVYLYLQLPLWGILLGILPFLKTTPLEHPIAKQLWLWGTLLFLGTYPLGMQFYGGYCLTPFLPFFVHQIYKAPKKALQVFGLSLIVFACCYGNLFAYRQVGWHIAPEGATFPTLSFPLQLDWPRANIWASPQSTYTQRTRLYYQLVNNLSKRKDDWFMYSDGPEVYFLTGHQNPTRYSYAIDSGLSDGRDIIQALEQHRVMFVLYELGQNHFDQPLLNAYLNRTFQLKAQVTPEILIFERRK
ncbi:MAG: glycosyltransferase family 39 protein [Vampirovibrionales bacterium]|nr:glycosyltransferase family 39 protein [Vampirovibrionales bacterium]